MTTALHRPRTVLQLVAILLVGLALAPGAAHAARCTTPYDPEGTTLVGARTQRLSMPAIAWLYAVYGNPTDWRPGQRHANVLRSVALRPCPHRRGAITVWTTNPPAMIRRAWRQPWIRGIDVQWVRVRYGGNDARRAVQHASKPATMRSIEQYMGGPVATIGDRPEFDHVRIGIDTGELPPDADAWATELLGVPTRVVLETQPVATSG